MYETLLREPSRSSLLGKKTLASPWARSLIGGGVWIAAWLWLQLPLVVAILLLAPLVLVRLALELIESPRPGSLAERVVAVVEVIELPAAISLASAFAFPTGWGAAALATPWLAVTGLLTGWGLLRIADRGLASTSDTLVDAGLVFVAIGGSWTFLSRLGRWPLDFEPIIVLLTGVHFHYAGVVLPIIAACCARRQPGKMAASAAWAIIVGTPLLAVGITASPVIEIVAACLLATGCVLVALLQIRVAWRQGSPTALTLLSASSMSLLAGMGLALFYAASEFLAAAWIDIPTMIPLHGTANAFGFALLGLLGWSLAERR